jgi:hypothetical protein
LPDRRSDTASPPGCTSSRLAQRDRYSWASFNLSQSTLMSAPSRGQKIPDFRSGRHRKTAKSGGKAVEKPGAAFPWLNAKRRASLAAPTVRRNPSAVGYRATTCSPRAAAPPSALETAGSAAETRPNFTSDLRLIFENELMPSLLLAVGLRETLGWPDYIAIAPLNGRILGRLDRAH